MVVSPQEPALLDESFLRVRMKSSPSVGSFFRIIPRYKILAKGDVIRVNHVVVFESVDSPGQYLHTSFHSFGPAQYDTDLSLFFLEFDVVFQTKRFFYRYTSVS
eukprot:m.39354 g.39354  ORF g.39354 m.39354 type:complete len:104 (+) comp10283_c0_seq11:653-964(+)